MTHGTQAPDPTEKVMISQRYDAFLGQLSVKGRASLEKHDELCAAEVFEAHFALWKRLAGDLGKLAGHATEVCGQHSVRFYIPDGKYKQQVFALEDTRQGSVAVYLPDVVQLAIGKKILSAGTTPNHFRVRGGTGEVELIPISAETRDITVCKAMVGWGRRALRAEFSGEAPEEHVHAIERMCELAAEKWAAPKE